MFSGGRLERLAHDAVASLRAEAGHNPYDRRLTDLVGELSTRSEEFRRLWASHDVRYNRSGTKVFHHPAVGLLVGVVGGLVIGVVVDWMLSRWAAVGRSRSRSGGAG